MLKEYESSVELDGDHESNPDKEVVQRDFWSDPQELIGSKDLKEQVKPVNLTVLEYGWLLKGKAGKQFIQYLTSKPSNSSIFNIAGIHTIVNS